VKETYAVSTRQDCDATGVSRSTVQYRGRRPTQEPLRQRLRELAAARVSYGYRRLHVLLRREQWEINIKRVRRLYREESLALMRRTPKRRTPKRRRSAVARPGQALATRPNERWARDFVHDALATREPFRVLTVIDCYTRECLALVARRTFRGEDVAAVLSTVATTRPLPLVIQCDQGTEFTSLALDHWAYWNKLQLAFSRPATPGDNARCEAFNGSLRRECLSQGYFTSLDDAQQALNTWQTEYNNVRPHSSLGDRPPAHFGAEMVVTSTSSQRPKLHA